MNELVSVIITTYNRLEWLKEAINSVQDQSYPNIEIIVVDSSEADIAEGVRVTCDPNTWCGACSQCQRGRVNLCPNNIATGIHRDGGFAVKRITLSRG